MEFNDKKTHEITLMNTQIAKDKAMIQELGGPAKVADLLNYDKKKGGVQRVYNWTSRGIPSKVKLENLDLFRLRA